MAQEQGSEKLGDLRSEAQRHILQQILETTHGPYLRDLAEAYAWLQNPGQSHGGSVTVQK